MTNAASTGFQTFSSLGDTIQSWISGYNIPEWLTITIFLGLYFGLAVILAIIIVYVLAYTERCITNVFAPYNAVDEDESKKHKILMPLAHFIKLFLKEGFRPQNCQNALFFVSPIIMFSLILCAFCLIPFGSSVIFLNQNFSGLFFMVFFLMALAIRFLAAYAGGGKFSFIILMQEIQENIALSIPMLLCLLGVSIMAGSLNINDIILAQAASYGIFGWFFVTELIAAGIFFVCVLIFFYKTQLYNLNAPVDTVFGYKSEYSGVKLAIFEFCEYLMLFVISLFFVCLFFGGYLSPFGAYILPEFLIFLEQIFWLLIKTFLVFLIIIAIRIATPKLSSARLLEISYRILIPLSLINLNISILIQYFSGVR